MPEGGSARFLADAARHRAGRRRAGQPAAAARVAHPGRLRRLVGRGRDDPVRLARRLVHRLARGADCGWPPVAPPPPLDLTSGSASNHRWRPSSRSCSAPGRRPSAASPSWLGTGWSAPTIRIEVVGERRLDSVRGPGGTPAGSAPRHRRPALLAAAGRSAARAGRLRCGWCPESVESLADHGDGLWGSARDQRVERGVARLQGMLGPEAVDGPRVAGRSWSAGASALSPWGERSRPRP